jgi:trans-2,3-dihydro-3-hydroxyanthranilate isomerase
MTGYAFHLLDVFTDTRLAGNQLAVLTEAEGLDGGRMQAIAREFNLSETVFLLPPTAPGHIAAARIFTPMHELGFAGHPVIGTTVLLDRLGRLPASGEAVLGLGAGPTSIRIADGTAGLTAPQSPRIVGKLDAAPLARLLGLDASDLRGEARIASAGTPFVFLELADTARLDALLPNPAIVDAMPADVAGLALFVRSSADSLDVRMFAPAAGIVEDPATGSAAAAIAALLLTDDPAVGGRTVAITQGKAMGRPSTIFLTPRLQGDGSWSADVAGRAVLVGEGRLYP